MYNVSTIQSEFITLVRWDISEDQSETMNPMGDLLTGSTGLVFNDVHPLLSINNLRKVANVYEDYTYGNYSAVTEYDKGWIVKSGSDYYVSLYDDNLNKSLTLPDVNGVYWWRQTNPFNEWLRKQTLSGIIKTINDLILLKGKMRTTHNLIKRGQVLDIPGYSLEDVGTTKDWIGWVVVPIPIPDVVLTINRLCLHLRGSENCDVKVFRNGEELETISFLGDGTNDPIWKTVNIQMTYGNVYTIAYDKTQLATAVPINGIYNMDKPWGYNRFPRVLPFAEVGAFEHDGPGNSGWEDVTNIKTNQNNFGLNMILSAHCDYTNFLVDQKNLIAPAIKHCVGMSLLRFMTYNPNARINRIENSIDDVRVLFEIDGDTLGRAGSLKKEYEQQLNLIAFDDKKFSEYCLPCRKSGIRIKTM